MTLTEFDLVLGSAAALCAVMAVVNLFLVRRRGRSALFLAGAFLTLGGTLLAMQAGVDGAPLFVGGAVVVVLLGADFATRGNPGKPR